MSEKVTFRVAWKAGQRCLIPASWYAEPNWETEVNIWWHLRRDDSAPWFIAGLWSEWLNKDTGELVPNYTMLMVNCNDHPLLSRLHRPDRDPETNQILPLAQQDKRSPVHIDPGDWDRWLHGSHDEALALLVPSPPEVFDMTDAVRTDEALRVLTEKKARASTDSLF